MEFKAHQKVGFFIMFLEFFAERITAHQAPPITGMLVGLFIFLLFAQYFALIEFQPIGK